MGFCLTFSFYIAPDKTYIEFQLGLSPIICSVNIVLCVWETILAIGISIMFVCVTASSSYLDLVSVMERLAKLAREVVTLIFLVPIRLLRCIVHGVGSDVCALVTVVTDTLGKI